MSLSCGCKEAPCVHTEKQIDRKPTIWLLEVESTEMANDLYVSGEWNKPQYCNKRYKWICTRKGRIQ